VAIANGSPGRASVLRASNCAHDGKLPARKIAAATNPHQRRPKNEQIMVNLTSNLYRRGRTY
jgi:hypothetical protein